MSTAGSSATHESGEKKAALAPSMLRNVIAALIGFYGVVLVVVGLVDNGDEALEKTVASTPTCGWAWPWWSSP